MATVIELEKQIKSAQDGLAVLQRDAEATRSEAAKVSKELEAVIDEDAAIALVGRERALQNKARQLDQRAGQAEAAIADLKRQVAEERVKECEAVWKARRDALIDESWVFLEKLEAAEQADRAQHDARSKLTGMPNGGSQLTREKQKIHDFMFKIGAAEQVSGDRWGSSPTVKRIGSQKQPEEKNGGIVGKAAAVMAAVVGG